MAAEQRAVVPGAEKETRARVLELLRRYGRNTTSFQVLESSFAYQFFGDDACVAYADTGGAWVAAGAPLAPDERLSEVAHAFAERARSHHRRALFFATENRFLARVPDMPHLRIGEQPFWDPETWAATVALPTSRSLREQLRRARAKKVAVDRLYKDAILPGAPDRRAIDDLIARWLGMRVMPAMGFLVDVEPFGFAEDERRYYVARLDDRIVGFLALVPIFGRGGFFFEDLLREPRAPNGTAELLFDAAMRDLATDGVRHATLGMAPLAGPVDRGLRLARRLGKPLYDFEGLASFKQKLRPTSWGAVHLSFPPSTWAPLALYDVLRAFAQRHLVTFGVATLLRGADIVVRVLTAMLFPWTLMLALAVSSEWFPSPLVKWTWVSFDVILTALLVQLSRKWSHSLATVLATLVTGDALLTCLEALAWNVPHARNVKELVVPVIAVAAPALAATVLWNARRRHALAAGPFGRETERIG